MACIGILERGSLISRSISEALSVCGATDIRISRVREGASYDAIVIGPEAPSAICRCSSGIFITPDSVSAHAISPLTARSVVSYGLCSKNTLTVSSLIGTKLQVSIQREIETLYGRYISAQDFCIDIKSAVNVDRILCVVAALLVADVSTEAISAVTFE